MADKFSLLQAKLNEHRAMSGIMGMSTNFWKNDMKMSKLQSPCCCKEEKPAPKEEPQNDPEIDQVLNQKIEKKQKNKILFKVKDESIIAKNSTSNTIQIKSETVSSSELKEKKKYNDWRPEEDLLLVKLCNSHYYKKWKKIASIIGNGKTPRMCAYRIKKLEKTMDLSHLKQQGKMMREDDFLGKETNSVRSSEKTSSIFDFKRKRKLKKLAYVRPINIFNQPQTYQQIQPPQIPSIQVTISQPTQEPPILKHDINKTMSGIGNLKIHEFVEPLAKIKSNDSTTSARKDYDMKSNSSNEKGKIQNLFQFSRKNSPEEEVQLNIKGNEFQKAYNRVFGYKKEKYSGTDLHKNFLEDESEMALKECNTDRRFDHQLNYLRNDFAQEKNEINFKQANSKKYFYTDLNNVDRIINGNDNFEQKNIKLAKFLIEINNLTKLADVEESKSLMEIQARILEAMINLTKQQSVG